MNDAGLPMIIQKTCDRCGRVSYRETESFFTDEKICEVCIEWELEIKSKLKNPEVYEKIGFVPEVKK